MAVKRSDKSKSNTRVAWPTASAQVIKSTRCWDRSMLFNLEVTKQWS